MTIKGTGSIGSQYNPHSNDKPIGELKRQTVTNLSHPSYASTNCFKVAMTVKAVALVALASVGALFAIGLIANPIGAIALGAIGGLFLTALIVNIAMKCFHNPHAMKLALIRDRLGNLTENKFHFTFSGSNIIGKPTPELIKEEGNNRKYSLTDSNGTKLMLTTIYPGDKKGIGASEVDSIRPREGEGEGEGKGKGIQVPNSFFTDQIQRSFEGSHVVYLGNERIKLDREQNLEFVSKSKKWIDKTFYDKTEKQRELMHLALLDSCAQAPMMRMSPSMTMKVLIFTLIGVNTDSIDSCETRFSRTKDGNLEFHERPKQELIDNESRRKMCTVQTNYKSVLRDFNAEESSWSDAEARFQNPIIHVEDALLEKF